MFLVDSKFWNPLLDWLRAEVITRGFLTEDELDLLIVVDDPDELVDQIVWCNNEKCYLNPEGLRGRKATEYDQSQTDNSSNGTVDNLIDKPGIET